MKCHREEINKLGVNFSLTYKHIHPNPILNRAVSYLLWHQSVSQQSMALVCFCNSLSTIR